MKGYRAEGLRAALLWVCHLRHGELGLGLGALQILEVRVCSELCWGAEA